jgi:RNA recognition motif-containing protein
MGWDIVAIKLVRQPPPSHASPTALAASPTSNNYAFITFPTAHLASRILHTLTPSAANPPIFMPNSARPFKANWASSSTTSSNPNAVNPAMASEGPLEREFSLFVGDLAPEVTEGDLVRLFLNPPPTAGAGPRKSFTSVRSAKIMLDPKGGGSRGYGFVRCARAVSSPSRTAVLIGPPSDLPLLSFAEEADQLRALNEMQGVYCLSRPMRLSHATAKNRSGLNLGGSQGGSSVGASSRGGTPTPFHGPGSGGQDGGRSSPYGGLSSATSEGSHLNSALDGAARAGGYPSRSSPSPGTVDRPVGQQQQQQPSGIPPPERRLSPSTIEYLTQLAAANGGTLPFGPGMSLPRFPGDGNRGPPPPPLQQQPLQHSLRHAPSMSSLHVSQGSGSGGSHDPSAYQPHQQPRSGPYDTVSPGSNTFPLGSAQEPHPGASHLHVNTALAGQARPEASPLSPLGGGGGTGQAYDPAPGIPGGVNSTDPNNTTVFVGGLSSLISEETLKTFFAPFGEITYAKIPPGKGCGFVQFVRKQDAERAIERMQGFPIGGGRIRLSWGRSQYKAAQAAAQAAQLGLGLGALGGINGLNPAQISQLGIALQNLGGLGGAGGPPGGGGGGNMNRGGPGGMAGPGGVGNMYGRPGQGGPAGLSMNGMPGGGGYGGFPPGPGGMNGLPPPPPPGGLGAFNLGALGNLNPQALQSLIALASNGGLGGGSGNNGMGDMNPLGGHGRASSLREPTRLCSQSSLTPRPAPPFQSTAACWRPCFSRSSAGLTACPTSRPRLASARQAFPTARRPHLAFKTAAAARPSRPFRPPFRPSAATVRSPVTADSRLALTPAASRMPPLRAASTTISPGPTRSRPSRTAPARTSNS